MSPLSQQKFFLGPRKVDNPSSRHYKFSNLFKSASEQKVKQFLVFTLTYPSPLHPMAVSAWVFLTVLGIRVSPKWLPMRKKTLSLTVESDFSVDLTLHQVPASLLTEFAEKVVRPYFGGNLNQAIQGPTSKSVGGAGFCFLSHNRNPRIGRGLADGQNC